MASKFKKKLKKFAKTAAKAAVIGGALYGGSKLLKGKGLKGNATLSTDRYITKPFKHDLESYKPKFKHPPYDAGADTSTYFKSGGRTSKKHGGRIGKQFGGGLNRPVAGVGSTARRDMRSGYYPSDMGMRGGPMYKKGGRVKSMGVAKRGGGVAKK